MKPRKREPFSERTAFAMTKAWGHDRLAAFVSRVTLYVSVPLDHPLPRCRSLISGLACLSPGQGARCW